MSTTGAADEVAETVRQVAQDVGLTCWVHARRLTSDADHPRSRAVATVGVDPHTPVATASLYKLPLALVWADLVAAGELDPEERWVLTGADRALGPTGVAMLLDDVSVTARDAVRLMLAVSDNACADAVLDRVGLERVNDHLRGLGTTATVIRHGSAAALRVVQRQTGVARLDQAESALADVDRDVATTEYDAALASSSTAAELGDILALLWQGRHPAHGWVRDAMARQAWRHRVASGFPHDDVVVHGKTGTLARLRHEAAVVCHPGEHPVAVTVLTRAARPERHQPRVDAAIGEIARRVVAPLRRPLGG